MGTRMSGTRTFSWLLPVLLAAAVLWAGAAAAQPKPDPKPDIVIGQIGVSSGPAGSYGRTQLAMIQIAAEDVNAKGGINGSMLRVEGVDAQLDPAQAVLRFRELDRRGVTAVIGPMASSQWQATAPLAGALKLPAITANSSQSNIVVRPWTLRLKPADDESIPAGFEAFLAKFPATRTVAIVADVRQSFGPAAVELLKAAAAKHDVKVLDVLEFSTGATDLSPLAIRIKALNPDLIAVQAVIPQALALAKEFQQQRIETPVLAGESLWPGAFASAVGSAGANWYTAGWTSNTEVVGNQALYATIAPRYLERVARDPSNGKPLVANTINAYDAVLLIATILRDKGMDGSTPLAQRREALKDGFAALKVFDGVLHHEITPGGDSRGAERLLRVDVDQGVWDFVR